MLIDYHIHTKRCRHATGEMEEYLETAYKRGLSEIGFSDHCPYIRKVKKSVDLLTVAMPVSELKEYVDDVKKIQKISKIPVKLGLEVDFFRNDYRVFNLLQYYSFDYFIGSVHFIDDWGFDQEEFKDVFRDYSPLQIYKKYFILIQEMAKSHLFDIVGHFDLPKKFGYIPPKELNTLLYKTLKIIKENNIALELNTSGKFKGKKLGYYPSVEILKLCFSLDIPITLGSDSHNSDEVGRDFNLAVELLKSTGYRYIVSFTNHKYKKVPL